MSILYRKVQNKILGSKSYQQWFGRAVILEAISTKELAEEISHSTTVTQADIMAVLTELAVVTQKHLLNSQRVVIDGIGSFRASLQTKPASKKEDFNANSIKGYRILFQPETYFTPTGVSEKGKRTGFRTKKLLQGATAVEMPKNGEEPKAAETGE